ncbi:MAG: tetratricopeptide repeat protein, partial [Candidatus Methylomirabilis sp.]|nr:tetratricopeptide repeat protein [Deltaproteobacteria bacterium]
KASSYLLALVFFVLSLLSKPMTITMPLVLLILDYYPLDRIKKDGWKKILPEKFPFFIVSCASGLITVWSQTEAMVPQDLLSLDGRLHVAARAYLFYIYKTLLPVNLAPFYHQDFAVGISLLFAVYVLALSAITALTFYMRKRSKTFLSAWSYFIITLLPVIGIMKVGQQAAADRYTYLPGMGLAVLVAAGAGWVVSRSRRTFAPALAALAVISALLSFLTLRQAAVWKDSISLWTNQIRLYPEQAKGYVGRGKVHLSVGRFDQALNDFDNAINLDPFYDKEVYLLRGGTLAKTGRPEEGLADLTIFVTSSPRDKKAYMARGTAYALAGRYYDALDDLNTAVELDPADPDIHIGIGKVYMHMGDAESSYRSMERALKLGAKEASRYIRELEENGQGRME